MPVVNRWLSGASLPDVYQFRDIANFFGVSYEWLLDGEDDSPSAEELAEMLGLSTDTVEELLTLSALESDVVLNALDDAIYGIVSVIAAAQENAE